MELKNSFSFIREPEFTVNTLIDLNNTPKFAASYHATSRNRSELRRDCQFPGKFLYPDKNKIRLVLDLCCGQSDYRPDVQGEFVKELRQDKFFAYGVDIGLKNTTNTPSWLIKGDVSDLSAIPDPLFQQNGSFDRVYCNVGVLSLLNENRQIQTKTLQEAMRVLKQNGDFIIGLPKGMTQFLKAYAQQPNSGLQLLDEGSLDTDRNPFWIRFKRV